MTEVFVSYANQDRKIALSVIDALTAAGLKVNHPCSIMPGEDRRERINAQIDTASCLIVLWSSSAAQSQWVQQEIQQAIQAWSDGRLVLATLDDTVLPIGLRDLQTIPLKPGPNGLVKTEVVTAAKAIVNQQVLPASELRLESVRAKANVELKSRKRVWVIAAAALAVIFFGWGWYQLSTPTPVSRGAYLPTEEQVSYAPTSLVILLILGIAIGAGSTWAWSSWPRLRSDGKHPKPNGVEAVIARSGSSAATHVFISYSRLDHREVERLVREIERAGYSVWIDRQASGAQRYAASIVQAIKSAELVALMCSQNSFSSDHVIREVYVAGDHKKPFIAFQLDGAEFPDDVLYFVSGFPRVSAKALDSQRLRSEIARLVPPLPASDPLVQ